MAIGQSRLNRKVALLGVCVVVALAAAGVVVAFLVGGGGTSFPALPTTGAYVPISVPKPLIRHLGVSVDPDSMVRQGQDLVSVISRAPGTHHYRLTISSSSGIGYIDSLRWYPPTGVSIVKLLGSTKGNCQLGGTTGFGGSQFQSVVLNPEIVCTGVHLRPPTCTCRADGGEVVISFVANTTIGLAGAVRIDSATPVLKIIPSSPQTPDEPFCAPHQASTRSNPCAAR